MPHESVAYVSACLVCRELNDHAPTCRRAEVEAALKATVMPLLGRRATYELLDEVWAAATKTIDGLQPPIPHIGVAVRLADDVLHVQIVPRGRKE